MNVSSVYRGQKRALDPQELELQVAVNCHVCWEATWVLCKSKLLITELAFQLPRPRSE